MPFLEHDRLARPLGPGVLTIGSAPEAGWRVTGYALAPVHALVTVERDGRAQVARPREDVRILVNGEAMDEPIRVIQVGDVITLGDATFHLRAGRHSAEEPEASFLRDMSRGRAWRIEDRLEVGRDMACAIHLPDPDVSRVHAEISRERNGVVVRPKGGIVFLNGARVMGEMPLSEGDQLGVGRTMLRFTHETPMSGAVIAPGEAPRRPSMGDPRLSRTQTTYMGVVQAREHWAKSRRKEWMKVVRIGLVGLAIAFGAYAIASGRAAVGLKAAEAAKADAKAARRAPAEAAQR
jgi:hypothetical protein